MSSQKRSTTTARCFGGRRTTALQVSSISGVLADGAGRASMRLRFDAAAVRRRRITLMLRLITERCRYAAGFSIRARCWCSPANTSWMTSSARPRSSVIAVARPSSRRRCSRYSASTSHRSTWTARNASSARQRPGRWRRPVRAANPSRTSSTSGARHNRSRLLLVNSTSTPASTSGWSAR